MCGGALPRRRVKKEMGLCPSYGLWPRGAKPERGAQPKLQLGIDGEAEPRLTSGGEAEARHDGVFVRWRVFAGWRVFARRQYFLSASSERAQGALRYVQLIMVRIRANEVAIHSRVWAARGDQSRAARSARPVNK